MTTQPQEPAPTDSPDVDELIHVERHGAVETVTMQRVDKRNALSAALMAALAQHVRRSSDDPAVRALVITGGPQVFSAGADLREALAVRDVGRFHLFWDRAWELTSVITESPLPVIAAIEGPCMTGGLELALACDFRVAAASANFAVTSARIGSVAGYGATQRLPQVIGLSRAKRMLFSGQPIDAPTAYAWGLVDELVGDGESSVAARELAGEFLGSAASSIALAKRAVTFGKAGVRREDFELERALCGWAFMTEERTEGMSAFLQRRPPDFDASGSHPVRPVEDTL